MIRSLKLKSTRARLAEHGTTGPDTTATVGDSARAGRIQVMSRLLKRATAHEELPISLFQHPLILAARCIIFSPLSFALYPTSYIGSAMTTNFVNSIMPTLQALLVHGASQIQEVYSSEVLETIRNTSIEVCDARYRTGVSYVAVAILKLHLDDLPRNMQSRHGLSVSRPPQIIH